MLASVSYLNSEVFVRGTNTLKFGSGSQWAGSQKEIEVPKQYLEDWFDLEMESGNFTLGLRFEAADSTEHNEQLKGITRRYLTYADDHFTVTAGDFYSIFGRGLVLDLKEEKADFFDSKITGGKVEFEHDFGSFKMLGGTSYFKYIDDIDPLNETVKELDTKLLGTDLSLNMNEIVDLGEFSLALGGSYLYMEGDKADPNQFEYNTRFIKKTEIGGVNLYANYSDFDFYNEYAVKTTFRSPVKKGWANYSSLTYGTTGLGITLEYKDYYNYGANPNEALSSFTPYQNPPMVVIDHASHLLNNHQHELNANDEIGYKLSVRGTIKDFDFTAIFAHSSKHDEDNPLPMFDNNYTPYLDGWLDGSYSHKQYKIKLGGGYFKDTPLSKGENSFLTSNSDEKLAYTQERVTGFSEFTYDLAKGYAIKANLEMQGVTSGTEDVNHDYEDYYTSLEFSNPEYGYIGAKYIKTTEEVLGDAPDNWFSVEAGFKLFDNHKLELFYGRERAGIKCTGGSCRQVPEFDGFKMSFVSTF